MVKEIFFSYNRKDEEFALKLAKELIANNLNVWIDTLNISAGERWDKSVETALIRCNTIIVVLSPQSVTSENVLDEVNFGFKKGKKIIPVIAKDCEIPFRLERLQYIDFRKSYSDGFLKLTKELEASPYIPQLKVSKLSKKQNKIMFITGSIIILFGLLWIYFNSAKKDNTFNLKFIVNSSDKDTNVKAKGSIRIVLNDTPRELTLDEESKAVFTDIDSRYLGKLIPVTLKITGLGIQNPTDTFMKIPNTPKLSEIRLERPITVDSILFSGFIFKSIQKKPPTLVPYATLYFTDFNKTTITDSLGYFKIYLSSKIGNKTNYRIFKNGKSIDWGQTVLSNKIEIHINE